MNLSVSVAADGKDGLAQFLTDLRATSLFKEIQQAGKEMRRVAAAGHAACVLPCVDAELFEDLLLQDMLDLLPDRIRDGNGGICFRSCLPFREMEVLVRPYAELSESFLAAYADTVLEQSGKMLQVVFCPCGIFLQGKDRTSGQPVLACLLHTPDTDEILHLGCGRVGVRHMESLTHHLHGSLQLSAGIRCL